MTEPQEQDRWDALAEELGLPPESTPTPNSVPAAPDRQKPALAEPVQALEPPASSPPSSNLGEGGEEGSPARGRRRRNPSASEVSPSPSPRAEREDAGPGDAASSDELAETDETPGNEERPRRRRRVRGSKKTRKSATAEPSAGAESEDAGEEERPRRRRRRRTKKADKESEALPAPAMEEDPMEGAPAEVPILDEEGDEEMEDFSTWNVPSWAEIIAGLYRPEH